jgi:AcrR family transcriptional regulator
MNGVSRRHLAEYPRARMATARPSPSRRLPRGRSALDAEDIAAHHRRRLHEAVIALLGEQGYGATTVQELASQAGVSTKDFYELFAGKQQLVLAACDAVIQDACLPLRARPVAAGDLRAALAAVLIDVVEAVVAEPAAARLAVIDIVAVGPQGLARRRSLSTGLHDLLRSAATVDGAPVLSEAALTVLAGGTLQILDRHLRAGKLRPLRGAAQELAAWGALYETGKPRALPGRDPLLEEAAAPVERTLPRGRHGLPSGFVRRYQRSRILEAVLQVSAEQGFEASSVKDLIAAAGLSPQAFYDNFVSKEEAWAAAFEEAFSQLYLAAWRAGSPQDDRATQVGATVAACLHYLASEPQRARLLLVDAPSAGRTGAPAIEEAMRGFEHLIAPALTGPDLPKLLPTAMIGGLAELAAGWVLDGRTAQLPDLTAAVIEVILTPTLGLADAVAAANAAVYGPPAPAEDDDRHRLMDAFAEAVARDGLAATRLADVAQEAGIELDVANALFDDELDCATKALDAWAGQLVIIAAGAFLASAGDPALAAHRALEAALWHMARTPAVAALAVSDDPELSRASSLLRERYIALFFQLVAGQVPVAEQRAPQPLAALALVLDGILATLRRFAEEHHVAELPGQLPSLSLQSLTPFFGADEARRVASLAAAAPLR